MDAQKNAAQSMPRVFSKPAGGFRDFAYRQLHAVWWAYRTGMLPEYLDFRLYLALHEFDEQRLAALRVRAKNKAPVRPFRLSYPALVKEVEKLVGSKSSRLVKASLNRLVSAGFVTIGETGLSFLVPTGPTTRRQAGLPSRLAVPRLMLRHIARGAPAAVAATAMGHLLCCVTWVEKKFYISGTCTASFISDAFGVDLRSVRRARRSLRELGWLVADDSSDADCGGLPNFAWMPPARTNSPAHNPQPCTVLSPNRRFRGTELSPPSSCTQLRSGSKNQQPPKPGPSKPGSGMANPPRLANVQPADLNSIPRLDSLFEQAARSGHIERSPAGRLKFFTAAARASRLGIQNPCGFFAAIVRGRLWHVLTQIDEDRALALLRADQAPTFEKQRTHKAPQPARQSSDNGSENAGLTGVADVMPQLLARLHPKAATIDHVNRKSSPDIGGTSGGPPRDRLKGKLDTIGHLPYSKTNGSMDGPATRKEENGQDE